MVLEPCSSLHIRVAIGRRRFFTASAEAPMVPILTSRPVVDQQTGHLYGTTYQGVATMAARSTP